MTYNEQRTKLLQALSVLEKENPITRVSSPKDIYGTIRKYGKKKQEHFIVICLNGAHQVIKVKVITIGVLNRCLVHPREVFRPAIINNSASIIIAHNHPSGNIEPSKEDDQITKTLKEAGTILGIAVLDHLIVSETKFYSYLEEGKL